MANPTDFNEKNSADESLCSNKDIVEFEEELIKLGFSDTEINELNTQLDGIIERELDIYFSKLYG